LDAAREELPQDARARLDALRVWLAYSFPNQPRRAIPAHAPWNSPHDPGQCIVSVDPQWDERWCSRRC
ncbi:hypothetical protein, partial [Streptomyces afghaniensis]|uniref:hypothetical protein n=1 Tax=Streptomyces afghaniensis TaxID=66865 RepID=UPI002468A6E4